MTTDTEHVVVIREPERVVITFGESGPPGPPGVLLSNVATLVDGTSITPDSDGYTQNIHTNTQAVGTLTVNAPSGTPVEGQKLLLRIKSTNVQTYAWDAIYRGSVDRALLIATTGAELTDYLGFVYNAVDAKWDFVAKTAGF